MLNVQRGKTLTDITIAIEYLAILATIQSGLILRFY